MTDGELRPSGTVTFMFTDIEGSTRLWESDPGAMREALTEHDAMIRNTVGERGGYVFSTAGDSFAVAFAEARPAVEAAIAVQGALAERREPAVQIRVRIGLHTGPADERQGDYFGPAVNRAARVMSAGHGGQILVSDATAALLDDVELVDLGEHRLKDLSAAERLRQVGSAAFPALRTLDVARHNLPVQRTTLIGREQEIAEISGHLGEHRLVSLLGIGGTGKTRLACAVGADVADTFPDGVWFVDLVPVSGLDDAVEAVASAARLAVAGPDGLAGLAGAMGDRSMLVILDNCEHVTDEIAELVDVLLATTTGPRVLITSREPLDLIDERHVHVPPLATGTDEASPAVQLFAATADRVGADLAGGRDLVAQICAQLDGLPLAIELAAAQLRHYTVAELAERLDQRFDLLTRGRGRRRDRQASLHTVLEGTWALLDDDEQELVRLLAAFPAGFSAQDAEGLARVAGGIGPVGPLLAGLVDRSVVSAGGDGRHRLLETVKLFARRRWPGDEPDRYHDAHAEWVLGYLRDRPVTDRYSSIGLMNWAGEHYDDHRAAEDRLAAADRVDDAVDLLMSLMNAYQISAVPRSSAVIDRVDRYLDDWVLTPRQRGVLRLLQSTASLGGRRPDVMRDASADAVDLLEEHGAPDELGWALMTRSWLRAFGRFDEALSDIDAALALTDTVELAPVADAVLSYRVTHLLLAGRDTEAEATIREIEDRIGERDFDYALLNLSGNITSFYLLRDTARADEQHRLQRAAFDVNWFQVMFSGAIAAALGEPREAFRDLVEAERRAHDEDDAAGLPDLLLLPATMAWRVGDLDRARRYVTAIRRAPRPTQSFPVTIAYRQLRGAVGLLDDDPLAATTIEDVYAEAREWLAGL